ncbi:MAG: 3-oxoacyl-ACP reductase [Hyphomicrobiales bacterium]|nr:MAG: 3-oxoacyl-ACP reductase [Hyphomicrobiales bacterium]
MDLGIAGKSAIICASSKGLGRGCAEALARAGCDIVINGRNADTLNETADAIRKATGAKVIAVAADVSTPEGQKALLAACPNPDILVNNNGGPPRKDYTLLDRAAIVEGVIQNMVTPIELIQAVTPAMKERGFGRIVNITSLSVVSPLEGLDLSSGARAGLTSFLAGVTRQLAPYGITINHILPGKMDTDRLRGGLRMSAKNANISEEEAAERQRLEIPAKRFGTPEEFGNTCAFLCSQHGGYINGQNVLLDGGLFASAF